MATIPTNIEVRRFGLATESTRGTLAASPTKWVAVTPDSEIEYVTKLLKDPALRGVNARYPSVAGQQVANGTIKYPVRAQQVGQFLDMLVGAPVSTQQGATTAYKHVFTPGTTLQLPSYSLFLDRGLSVKGYNLGVTKKLKFSGKNDGFVDMEASVMAQKEATGSIGTPSFTDESAILEFFHTTVKFAGSAPANANVKSWDCTMDNGMTPYFPQAAQQYATDLLAKGPFMASGNLELYFMDETERAKFIAGTATSLEFSVVGPQIASTGYYYTLDLLFDEVLYEAFPFGDIDGYLGAKVKWEAFYSTANTRLFQAYIINTITAYPV